MVSGFWAQALSGGGGYSPQTEQGVSPHRRAPRRLCAAGGMPLAFTQEDFLVSLPKGKLA